jgi:hypothetical protein
MPFSSLNSGAKNQLKRARFVSFRNRGASIALRTRQTGCWYGKGKETDQPRAQAGPGARSAGQDYEVDYETKKTRKSAAAVKKAVKQVGNSRKRVERRLGR